MKDSPANRERMEAASLARWAGRGRMPKTAISAAAKHSAEMP
jgi:hypothetical protein